jgi:putative sigma-54 modulation protein
MQFSVTFRHMEASEALKSYAKERMDRIRKYLPDPIACHVVFGVERHNHRVDVNFQLHNGLAIAGHETTENMYSSIDLVIAKIERQVRRYKGKIEEQRVRPHNIAPLPWSHSIVEEAPGDGQGAPAPQEVPAPEASTPAPTYKVVKSEEFQANPMTVDDAIAQLDLTHASVLVFRSIDAGNRVAVVYRRDDGSYGLIETPVGA